MAEISDDLDLFGEPRVEPKETRGRKAHVRSVEVSKKVAISRAMGRTEAEIAELVGLDAKTLRKYYSRELQKASQMVKALLDEALFQSAIVEGKVGSQRLLYDRLRLGEAAVPLAPIQGRAERPAKAAPKPKAAPKSEKLGKKAQAALDAQTADQGTSWGKILN
ncbi:MAG: hypothetical protein KIS90_00735 [Phenylobacterium sp.]|nr:hypothetical protein [Phenylobacterium sp.]